jgi:hypothetical protein
MVHGAAQDTVYGGPTTVAGHRAQRISVEWPLRGVVALLQEGGMEGVTWYSRGITH